MGNTIKLIFIFNWTPTVGMKLHIKKAKLYEHMNSNPPIVIAKVKGTSKLHKKGTREFGVT